METELVLLNHDGGFFSSCSVRLTKIIDFFNTHKCVPNTLNVSDQFKNYKTELNENIDKLCFKPTDTTSIDYKRDINHHWDYQFIPYTNLDYEGLAPFIRKYFTPSDNILNIAAAYKKQYDINFDKTVSVFYRGNDKHTETGIASYQDFIQQSDTIYKKDKDVTFFVQTDEIEFRNKFCSNFNNSFFIEEIPAIKTTPNAPVHRVINNSSRTKLALDILAVTYIISKTKYIITHSGNCGIWAMLFRGNNKNVCQYLQHNTYKTNNPWIINLYDNKCTKPHILLKSL